MQGRIPQLKHALSKGARCAAGKVGSVRPMSIRVSRWDCQTPQGVAGAASKYQRDVLGTLQVRCGSSIRSRLTYCSAHATARRCLSYCGARDRSRYKLQMARLRAGKKGVPLASR